MGRRSATESVAAIYEAFLTQRTWAQAELARTVGIQVPALRRRLEELAGHHMPLEREEEDAQVYWSVPRGWLPGGVSFPRGLTQDLLRLLWHSPRSTRRARLLGFLLGAVKVDPAAATAEGGIVTRPASEAEEELLPVVEDAMAQRVALSVRYQSARNREEETRHVSVHRVYMEPPARLAVVCHRSGTLKWFRVEFLRAARADPTEPFRPVDPAELEAFIASSIDGYHGPDRVEQHVFFVREPEARWVVRNLVEPMQHEPADGGVRVTAATAGATRVARFVVGLGAAARAETAALRAEVEALARGALGQAGAE